MASSATAATVKKPTSQKGRNRRGRPHPKGRQITENALEEIRALLGDAPRERAMLIEYLHLINDEYGYLSAAHLAALAHEMRLSMTEVYEVATFYAHFTVVKEGEEAPKPVTIRVCDSLSCELAGGDDLMDSLAARMGGNCNVVRAPCMGACECAPVCEIGHRQVGQATASKVAAVFDGGDLEPEMPDYTGFDAYCKQGGYALLKACLNGDQKLDAMVSELEKSGLRGLGGAGFPTFRKWQFVRSYEGPRYMVVNADEGEPGTFKDRYYLERDPHRVLEGMLISTWAVDADAAYIYLRDEYPAARKILLKEIEKVTEAGLAPKGGIHLRRGAGAYICGEESAMLESIEGKRGLPRHRPPFAAEVGLFGRPTLINNVETVYWLRDIFEKGADWFASQGREGHKGPRSFSVSGRVKEPGVKIAPAGITARELIEEYCGGMADGHTFRAYLPGGASGGILPAGKADIPLDFGRDLDEHGCFIGSHAVIVLSDKDDMREVALNLMKFFADESCGQCTPCRAGTEKMIALLQESEWDEALMEELSQAMRDASICGLGQAAPNPVKSIFNFFRDDIAVKGGA